MRVPQRFTCLLRFQRVLMLVTLVTVAATGFVFSASGRSPVKTKQQTNVKPTVRITNRPSSPAAVPSSLVSEAAIKNTVLRNELPWTFGGKQQRGWYLYDQLIGQTLEIRKEVESNDFSTTLATWQKRKGLTTSGVLDEDSLMRFVSEWQGNRLKDKTPALPDQLLTAPTSDFYDPGRLPELRQVERNTYAAYKHMIAAAIADPSLKLAHTSPTELASTENYFKIISAFRSREYQEELRRKSPNAGRAGLAVNSPHFTGRALDLYVGGNPVDTMDSNRAIQVNSSAYKWLVRNAGRFGFRPYFYEPWHWEYVGSETR